MKVGFFDKSLWKEYFNIISILNIVITTALIFLDIPQENKINLFICFVVLLVIVYIVMIINANMLKKLEVDINNSKFVIKEGNIFKEDGLKVINFNEYFDTLVDNKIISKNSLNGQFINNYVDDICTLDKHIIENANSIGQNSKRKNGKKSYYDLGTLVEYNDYLLTAFSKFTSDNRAEIDLKNYLKFLMTFWNNLDIIFANRNVNITLFGSGITRFNDVNYMNEQELLEIIIWTFKISRIKFKYPSKITLIIPKEMINKLNLYKIKEMF